VTGYPWEPPLAGTEVEHLVGALERLRTDPGGIRPVADRINPRSTP
jgi:hypothetical protein